MKRNKPISSSRIIWLCIGVMLLVTIFPHLLQADDVDRQVQNKLNEILASKEFAQQDGQQGFFYRLSDQIEDIWTYLKEKLNFREPQKNKGMNPNILGQAGPLLNILLSITIIGGMMALIVFLLYKQLYKSKNLEVKHGHLLTKMVNKPDEVREQIRRHYEAGDYTQAFRYTYISLLVELNSRGLIRIDKSKTNRQYLRELQKRNFEHYAAVEHFTTAFNDYWYGGKPMSKEEFEQWEWNCDSLLKGGGA